MREPQYSLLADIQYDIELARQGKFALYGQRSIAREYRCKKATPEEQQAYETLQNVLFMVPQWSDTEELHSDMERIGGRVWFCYFWEEETRMEACQGELGLWKLPFVGGKTHRVQP